jgi:hypothetical protein
LRPIEQETKAMLEFEIHDYARQLFTARGDKAVAVAAQKARAFEEKGKSEDATVWRRVEAAIKLMLGPHQS